MADMSLLSVWYQRLRALRAERRGNVTITFALATIPIIGAMGAAVDYSRANSARTALQAAVDSTALMLSKDAPSLTSSQLNTKATAYFQALFTRPEAQNAIVTPSYSNTDGSQVVVTGTAQVPTKFVGLLGFDKMNIAASSTVKWGNSRLRVALVLDNTGSMSSSGKMTALKTATNNLLDQLKAAAATPGDVYVSIIPFNKNVNVDPSKYNATWIDWTNWSALNGTCNEITYKSQSSCESHTKTWKPDNHNTWNGCVTDRGDATGPSSGNYDTNVVAPTTTISATLFPAEQYSFCPQQVMSLNYNWANMKTLVNGMTSSGNTNQAIGLAHGWMSLVGGGPYPTPPAEDPNYKYSKVIILLTDGLNTQDRWYTIQSKIDARQQLTCNNIKAAGITLYTIQVNTSGDPTSTLLQNCASGSDKFFLLTSANQIVSTFNQIGTALSNLHIAQ